MRRYLVTVMVLGLTVLAGCVAPPTPAVDTGATEAAIAANVLATLTAAAPPSPAAPDTPAPPVGPTCSVTVEGLNLRSGPGTAYESLAALAAGALLVPLAYVPDGDPEGPWIQVRLAEGTGVGWVAAGAVSCNIDPAGLPVAALPSKVTATPTATATFRPEPVTPLPPTNTATATRTPTRTATPTPSRTPPPPLAQVTLPGAYPNGMAVDPDRGNLFIAGRDTNTLYVVDRSLRVVRQIPLGRQPFGVAYLNGYVHVANFGSGSITVVNAVTLEPVSNPPGSAPAPETAVIQRDDSEPTFIAADPPRNRVVVALHGLQDIYRRYLYVYGVEADGSLGRWGSVSDLPGVAYGVATVPSLTRAYVSHRDAFAIMAVDTANSLVVEAESLRGLPFSPYLVASLDGLKNLYVTHNTPGQPVDAPDQLSWFVVTPGSAPRLVSTITVGELNAGGGALAIYPWRDDMWRPESPFDGSVLVGTRDRVTAYDASLVEQRVFGPADGIVGQPSAIAADPVLRRIYVAEGATGRIVVLSGW